MEELFTRLPGYAERAAAVPTEAHGSIEERGRVGKHWWEMREQQGLNRYKMAELMGQDVDHVRHFEVGLSTDTEFDTFPALYAKALGNMGLYQDFLQQFGLTPGAVFAIENPFASVMPEDDGNRRIVVNSVPALYANRQRYEACLAGMTAGMPPEQRAGYVDSHPFTYSIERA
ncbi:MAG: hypothetical protein HY365_03225 [Candidatus Aenigmarchaeota archaeon]|nr:hypothetical protein [Candidatus Aenigmarchaeota archaeon]